MKDIIETSNRLFIAITFMFMSMTTLKAKESLNEKQSAIIPIAAFTAKGDLSKLKTALNEGLDSGLTVREINEVLTQLYAYAGFPRSLNGINEFMSLLDERKSKGIQDTMGKDADPMPAGKTSLEIGTEIQTWLSGSPVKGGAMDFTPVIDYYLKAHLFGDIFLRNNIEESSREIATLTALSALSGTEGQIKAHLRYARNSGLSESQILEIPLILKAKVGAAEAYMAAKVMNEVFGADLKIDKPISDVFPRVNVSSADYFTGQVFNAPLVRSAEVNISNVTFNAGARTRWHSHSGTQILLCTGGNGWYVEKEGEPRMLKQGDTVFIEPATVHWHGAAREGEFSHLSVIPNPEKNKDEWFDPVDEDEYKELEVRNEN